MPELPEVEAQRRMLEQHVVGYRIAIAASNEQVTIELLRDAVRAVCLNVPACLTFEGWRSP